MPAEETAPDRFHLRRRLGRGSRCWLAFDTVAARDVALSRQPAPPGVTATDWTTAMAPLLALRHPNLVPLLEVVMLDGDCLRLSEFVPGIALSNWIAQHGAMPPRQAVQVVVAALDALIHAHQAGLVHGGIRPSRLLLDPTARPLLCDFALEPLAGPDSPSDVAPLSRYLAPEQARGGEAGPASDVFSLALVLGELLAGRALLRESSARQGAARTLAGAPQWPATPEAASLDDALRRVVRQALADEPSARPDAAEFRAALVKWLEPALLDRAADDRAAAALRLLMQRIDAQPDLPAQGEALRRVRLLAAADRVNLDELAFAVLDDMALTLKLLRLGNAACFSSSGGSVTQVSRAVALLGFAAVRDLAGSLPTLEDLSDANHAAALRQEYERARLAARVAAQLCPSRAEEEESAVTATLQHLGRALVQFHLPDAALAMHQRMQADERCSDSDAARRVIGTSFDALGVSVARSWGLPEPFLRGVRRPEPSAVLRAPDQREDWLRLLASLGTELAGLPYLNDAGERQLQLRRSIERYGAVLRLRGAQIRAALEAHGGAAAGRADAGAVMQGVVAAAAGQAEAVMPVHPLSRALLALQALNARPHACDEAIVLAGEAIAAAVDCRRVVIVLRDARKDEFLARRGFGAEAAAAVEHFRFAAGGTDLFAALCARGVDTLIGDASAASIAARLPDWHRRHFPARAFLLLPLVQSIQGHVHALGLLYVDSIKTGGLKLSDRELSLLRSLRGELLKALQAATDAGRVGIPRM